MAETEFKIGKKVIIDRLFLTTADNDYVTARLCYFNRHYQGFFWNSAQALEKYLKASLLFNNCSALSDDKGKEYGHDLIRLYHKIKTLAQDLIPQDVKTPPMTG